MKYGLGVVIGIVDQLTLKEGSRVHIAYGSIERRRILQFLWVQHTVPHYTIPIPLCQEHKHIENPKPKFVKELDTAFKTSSANTHYFSRFLGVFRTRRVHAKN